MKDHASPGCAIGPVVSQQDFMDGLRGMPIGPDGTQGVPERSKASSKKKVIDSHGWTSWDLKMAAAHGMTIADLNARRSEGSAWIDAFQARVRSSLVAQGIFVEPARPASDVPF